MDTFNFPYHSVTHTYPKGDSVKFGKGYTFNAKPILPFQRVFRLHFNAMQWFLNSDGTLDHATNATYNIQALIDFFEAHDTSQAFTYIHPAYGPITVKFSADQTFEIPKTIDGAGGTTESLDLFLVEQPGL